MALIPKFLVQIERNPVTKEIIKVKQALNIEFGRLYEVENSKDQALSETTIFEFHIVKNNKCYVFFTQDKSLTKSWIK